MKQLDKNIYEVVGGGSFCDPIPYPLPRLPFPMPIPGPCPIPPKPIVDFVY